MTCGTIATYARVGCVGIVGIEQESGAKQR